MPYETIDNRTGRRTAVGAEDPDGPDGDHLALTVLLDGERWLVDTGLAGGMYEPVGLSSFDAEHRELSTSPDSGFVRVLQVQLRDAKGVDMLRGCVLRRIEGEGTSERTVDSADDRYDVLTDVFRLDLSDVDAPARAALWDRVRTAHQEWAAAQECQGGQEWQERGAPRAPAPPASRSRCRAVLAEPFVAVSLRKAPFARALGSGYAAGKTFYQRPRHRAGAQPEPENRRRSLDAGRQPSSGDHVGPSARHRCPACGQRRVRAPYRGHCRMDRAVAA
ncbi:hypothetical protein GCM10009801_18820 [Streptomyces albiaxialis]|uniref:Uncharacterized protein n=1 Tax=Streptomyces albiaxialis TaxID=329523 RepID=A0ABN2VQN8_9ACTN